MTPSPFLSAGAHRRCGYRSVSDCVPKTSSSVTVVAGIVPGLIS